MEKIPHIYGKNRIVELSQSLDGFYQPDQLQIPLPIWRTKGFEDSCFDSWRIIDGLLCDNAPVIPNQSIYIHIPYCSSKCGFCDCFSIEEKDQLTIDKYVQILIAEMKVWARLKDIAKRHVTVVQFGGGSPSYLSDENLRAIFAELSNSFSVDSQTQIYMECNSVQLSEAKIRLLKSLGVTRISLGIQTMEEPLRSIIGRVHSKNELITVINRVLDSGITTAADIIYGLPNQTYAGYLASLEKLVEIGVQGISLYPFVVSDKNQKFVHSVFPVYKKNGIEDFISFLSGHLFLNDAKYQKNFFLHFAKPEDQNLYYRHLLRSEDLIALGATADGIVGFYRYRNHGLPNYIKYGKKGLFHEGGVWELNLPPQVKSASIELMCGKLNLPVYAELSRYQISDKWLASGLLNYSSEHEYALSATGSWFVNAMITEVNNHYLV
ncbi:MAG: radical SAM protein [Candidatus Cloacimonas sp.]|nr:radical SAM protein [Candidatus Cloacimonas sp.]